MPRPKLRLASGWRTSALRRSWATSGAKPPRPAPASPTLTTRPCPTWRSAATAWSRKPMLTWSSATASLLSSRRSRESATANSSGRRRVSSFPVKAVLRNHSPKGSEPAGRTPASSHHSPGVVAPTSKRSGVPPATARSTVAVPSGLVSSAALSAVPSATTASNRSVVSNPGSVATAQPWRSAWSGGEHGPFDSRSTRAGLPMAVILTDRAARSRRVRRGGGDSAGRGRIARRERLLGLLVDDVALGLGLGLVGGAHLAGVLGDRAPGLLALAVRPLGVPRRRPPELAVGRVGVLRCVVLSGVRSGVLAQVRRIPVPPSREHRGQRRRRWHGSLS